MTTLPDDGTLTVHIYSLLYLLGASANSIGFFHTAYAVRLAVKQPETLLMVTKWLYPEVARHYHTNWRAVERNIRRLIAAVWKTHGDTLAIMAGRPLPSKPTASQFLSILAACLKEDSAA